MERSTDGCPIGMACLSCRTTTGLRVRIDSGPLGDMCWTACERCSRGWVPLRMEPRAALWLADEHRRHLGLPPRPDPNASPPPHPMTLPGVLSDPRRAVHLLDRYFRAESADGHGPLYTGGQFERFGGAGDRSDIRDVVTTEDLLAVSMLSVQVSARATLRLVGPDRSYVEDLLRGIPADVDLVDADDKYIGRTSDANALWHLLRGLPGVGPVTAGKLLARKRPRLVPVVDSVVLRTLDHPGPGFWLDLRHRLRAHDRALHDFLTAVLQQVGLEQQVSVIRAFDVLVWLTGKGHVPDDRAGSD